jgi:hypothetical protein
MSYSYGGGLRLTGRYRYRLGLFKCLVLQIEKAWFFDGSDIFHNPSWVDAAVEDLVELESCRVKTRTESLLY